LITVNEAKRQLHEGNRVWGGSVERNSEPMNKNRIEGVAEQGEWARYREANVIKAKRRKSGGCAIGGRLSSLKDTFLLL